LAAQLVAPFQRLIELIPAAGLRLDYGWRLPMDVLGELARVLAAEPGSGESSLDGPIPGGPAAGQPSPGRSRPDGSRPGGSDAEEPSPAESRPGGLAAGWLAPGESELDPFDAAESAAEVGLPAIAASGRVADQARRLGLIRLAKGFYHRTKAAQSLVDDPLGLWRHIAGRAFAGAMQPTDRCGGILLCCAIGEGLTAPWTAYARLVADGLDQVGWQHPDHSPITATEAEALTWATATLLRTLGVWSRRWDAEIDPEAALTPTPPGVRAAQELVRLSLPADVDQTLAGIRGQMQENVANELLQNFQGLDDAVAWDGEDPDDPADDESQDNRVGEELGEDEDWDDEEYWDEDWDEDDDQDWDDDGDWDEADEEDGDDGEDDRPLTKQQEAAAFEETWDFFGGVFERMLEMTDPDRLRGNSDRE
jgi:hypothetical protein